MFQASFKERIKQVKFHGNIFNFGQKAKTKTHVWCFIFLGFE